MADSHYFCDAGGFAPAGTLKLEMVTMTGEYYG
jgi:hypothetical protein